MRLLFFFVAASCVVLFPAVAMAQCEDATAAYDEALELLEAGEPEDALELFRCAYEAEPTPNALYGVAQCYVALGRYDPAIDILDTLARENQRFSERMDIERLITDLQEFVAELEVQADSSSAISHCYNNAYCYTSSGSTTITNSYQLPPVPTRRAPGHRYTSSRGTAVANHYQLPPIPTGHSYTSNGNTTVTNNYQLPPVPAVPTRRTLGNKLSWVAFSGALVLTVVGSALLIRGAVLYQEFKETSSRQLDVDDDAGWNNLGEMAGTVTHSFKAGWGLSISGLTISCASILLLVFLPGKELVPGWSGSRANVHLSLSGLSFTGSF
jgi:tetratricopeptide (TPR) repeat protein